MPKYINLDDYCKNVCKCNADSCDKEKCPLWAAPACDVVEVVRCKDCKHYSPDNKKGLLHSPCDRIFAMSICHEDSFCSFGERKEENE